MSPFVDTLSLLALAGMLASASGCSLRYDPDDLGDDSGEQDDGSDVGPDELFVEQVFPRVVHEGEGFVADPDDDPGVRAIPIVLFGQNMTADTTFSISGDGVSNLPVEAQVSPDGRWAAFAMRVPIVDDDAGARDVDLRIAVTKGDETREVEVTHRLLPELRAASSGGEIEVINTDDLSRNEAGISEFSRVELSGHVQVIGDAPFRVVGYGGISVSGLLEGNGIESAPGAGGCAGGAPEMDAPCGPGSGRAGDVGTLGSGGGGGGGFASVGLDGAGAAAMRGEGGMTSGDPSLVPMPPGDGAPAGGGGGGGVGGGSGGIIELTTPGLLALSGAVHVNGASGVCNSNVGGVGGGGGSGGAILVRAGSLAERTSATLQALGGPVVECTVGGGGGGEGRIRFDLPALPDQASVSTQPDAGFIGPAFVTAEIPTISTDSALPVTVRGEPGGLYELSVTSPEGTTDAEVSRTEMVETSGSEGVGEISVDLLEGFNRLCLRAVPTADPDSYPEAANCLNVAYISP
jgi:hypothetical protein